MAWNHRLPPNLQCLSQQGLSLLVAVLVHKKTAKSGERFGYARTNWRQQPPPQHQRLTIKCFGLSPVTDRIADLREVVPALRYVRVLITELLSKGGERFSCKLLCCDEIAADEQRACKPGANPNSARFVLSQQRPIQQQRLAAESLGLIKFAQRG